MNAANMMERRNNVQKMKSIINKVGMVLLGILKSIFIREKECCKQ